MTLMLVVARLTSRQLLGKKRTLLFGLLALMPVVLAFVFRLAANDLGYTASDADSRVFLPDDAQWVASALLATIIVGSLLPLAALIFSTAALGSEIEDGTAVYLLSKPVPRWQILLPKLVVAWLVTCLFVVPPAVIASIVAFGADPEAFPASARNRVGDANELGIILGFSIAIIAGAALYTTMFTFLSIATTRAFIIGLVYVFLWEGIVTRLFTGTRIFSVRQYSLGIAELFGNMDTAIFDARLGGIAAVLLMLAAGALCYWFGLRRLQRWEIGEAG
ncbi:MAG: ABC transporter permease [Dehalococcoidia bacterium]|nr:ABC transporter permease [Dehalococcoidia bacterium]